MIILLNSKKADGSLVMDSSGKVKNYKLLSAKIEQAWFNTASAQINLNEKLLESEHELTFILKDGDTVVFEGQIISIVDNATKIEINLQNMPKAPGGESLLSRYLSNTGALKRKGLLLHSPSGEQKSIFDFERQIFTIRALEVEKNRNLERHTCHICVQFRYSTIRPIRVNFQDVLFGEEEGVLKCKLTPEICKSWPKVGSELIPGVMVVESSIELAQAASSTDIWDNKGTFVIKRDIIESCEETWEQVVNPNRGESIFLKIAVDYNKYLWNLPEWTIGRKYYQGEQVLYTDSQELCHLLYCKKSHFAKGPRPTTSCWEDCGDGYGFLDEGFFYESTIGKKLRREVLAYAMLEYWSKYPEESVQLKVYTSEVRGIQIGDEILLSEGSSERYMVVAYTKKYGGLTSITAYKMPVEKLWRALAQEPKATFEEFHDFANGPLAEIDASGSVKLYLPRSNSCNVTRVVIIGDIDV